MKYAGLLAGFECLLTVSEQLVEFSRGFFEWQHKAIVGAGAADGQGRGGLCEKLRLHWSMTVRIFSCRQKERERESSLRQNSPFERLATVCFDGRSVRLKVWSDV